MIPFALLKKQVDAHPCPLVFATISGAHLYGFPSPDSDFDLRGVHLLPLSEVVGLETGAETIEKSGVHDGLEIDLVTHGVRKFRGAALWRWARQALRRPAAATPAPFVRASRQRTGIELAGRLAERQPSSRLEAARIARFRQERDHGVGDLRRPVCWAAGADAAVAANRRPAAAGARSHGRA